MSENKKPSILKNATSHYQRQIAGDLKKIHVPEWDADLYYRTVSTLRAESEVVELTRAGKSVEALVVSIINKARDEEGNLVFSKHDKATLMNEVDPQVILRVAGQMNGSEDLPTIEELEKNQQETQILDL